MLFEDFEAITYAEWKNLILKTIQAESDADKRAFYETKLVRHPEPGIEIQPFYTAENSEELNYLKGFHRLWTQTRQTTGWMNVQAIAADSETAANAQAQSALAQGADAVWFMIPAPTQDYTTWLGGLSPEHTPLYFSGLPDTKVLDFLSATYPVSACMGGVVNPADVRIATFCQKAPYFRMLFQTDEPPDSLVEELVGVLQKAMAFADNLSSAGMEPASVLPGIGFMMHTDNQYFLQIAKLRALRLLWWQIGRLYDPTLNLVDVFVYATVQAPPPPEEEPYKSLISNTTQAMSAIIGGCDALSVVPALPTDPALGIRMARNISVILQEESYLDTVTDAGAGSFLIESLTHQLAKAVWERLSV